jgi:hypothetical protein
VFDEVDAGIGGETAHAVGALLRSLAAGGQALCVTHLAQVAAFADRQVRVAKTTEDTATRVRTVVLEEGERVDEIARMLGGRLSAQSRGNGSTRSRGCSADVFQRRAAHTPRNCWRQPIGATEDPRRTRYGLQAAKLGGAGGGCRPLIRRGQGSARGDFQG